MLEEKQLNKKWDKFWSTLKNYSLIKKWGKFLLVILDPWVITLAIATIYFIYYSNKPKTVDKNILTILTLFISLFSAILGGVLANKWAEITEAKVLVTRGKSAIRSLKLILLNISKIEKRTEFYIKSINGENKDFQIVISNFQEVIEKCSILQEEILSSIEDWTDIIPEVENMKTQIGVISDMKLREKQLESDVNELNTILSEVKEGNERDKQEINNHLINKTKELEKVQKELSKAKVGIDDTILSGLTSLKNYNNNYVTVGTRLSELGSFLSGNVTTSPQLSNKDGFLSGYMTTSPILSDKDGLIGANYSTSNPSNTDANKITSIVPPKKK